jgi:hypothetical protein
MTQDNIENLAHSACITQVAFSWLNLITFSLLLYYFLKVHFNSLNVRTVALITLPFFSYFCLALCQTYYALIYDE